MKAAQHRYRDDPARLRRLDPPGLRSIFFQCQMYAAPMIIFQECLEMPVQTSLVEDDQVIQALAANGTDHTLHVSALPR